ncbi:LysR family transcriptional regulator [Caulobacter sp. LARHSG274]
MSWAGIDEFTAVVQTRNFTRAAKQLGCSTSQISREIAALEERLGQRLLYRTTRHVSLTDAGERLILRCRRLVEERDEAFAELLAEGDQLQGQLRITCSVAYGERFIVPLLNRLMVSYPKLSVDLMLTDEMLDLVEKGVDLAVRSGTLRDSRLVATRLTSRTRLLCASPAYLARHGTPTNLDDLGRHVCLRGTSDTWTFDRDDRVHIHRPQGRFRCNSGQAVLEAALDGLGVCRLPDFYVEPHIARGDLVELLAEHRPADEGVWAVYPNRRHLSAKVRTVIEQLSLVLNENRLRTQTGLRLGSA